MNTRRAIATFWAAVVVAVFALGIAWSAWKASSVSPVAFGVAVLATLVSSTAALVAGRILTALTRASQSIRDH